MDTSTRPDFQPRQRQRFLAPDLARGVMLSMIALANVMIYLHDRPYGLRQHVITGNTFDEAVSAGIGLFVDARAYPLFAALFGYGIVQMIRSRQARGMTEDEIHRTVRRRSAGLILFGGVHAVLAFSGDILGWYGLIGLVLVRLLRLRNRMLLHLAAIWLVVSAIVQGAIFADPMPSVQRSYFWSYAISDPLGAAGWRLGWCLGIDGPESQQDVRGALAAGARSYLLKDIDRARLFEAVLATAHGRRTLSPSVQRQLDAEEAAADPVLSDREREVLTLVAAGRTNAQVGAALFVGAATVKTHLQHIFAKLGAADRAAAVAIAYRRGLL